MKALLIAEKPLIAMNIKKVYTKINFKDDITITSARGHLIKLAYPEEYGIKEWERWSLKSLPIIPNNFKYLPIKETYDYLKNIQDEIKKNEYDYIINACDAGREGELIFGLVYEYLKCKIPVKRLWINEYTDKGIKEGLNNLKDDSEFKNLKLAAKYRQWFDWLLGMNLTRVVTLKTNEKISVGRVMTPTLAILAERENEILNFKSISYWEIESIFKEGFNATWFNKETKETKIINKSDGEKIYDAIKGIDFGTVVDIKNKENINYPSNLPDLGDLQKESNQTYGYSLSKTLSIAQSLYEKHKLITYPRTDSKYLNKNITEEFKMILNSLLKIGEVEEIVYGIIERPENIYKISNNKKYIDDSKVTDHHAIIPTQQNINISNLTTEELNVYLIIVKRFLSIFMPPCITSTTNVTIKVKDELFKTESKMLIDLGYKIMYPLSDKDTLLPKLEPNQKIHIKKTNLKEKQTKAPSRYNDATILTAMESAGKFIDDKQLQKILKDVTGIGTPSTRAGIIDKLIKLELIKKEKRNFITTDLGIKTIESLKGQEIVSPSLTAIWENKLKQLEEDKYDSEQLYFEIIEYTKKSTIDFLAIDTLKKDSFKKEDVVVGICPKCNDKVIEGKKYYRCINYKDSCDFIFSKEIYSAKITTKDAIKILSGEKSSQKNVKFKNGKGGKTSFVLNSETKKIVPEFSLNKKNIEKIIVGKCPICEKNVIITANYFMCEEYKKTCNFIFPKNYKNTIINEEDAKILLKGETCIIDNSNKKIQLSIENEKVRIVTNTK